MAAIIEAIMEVNTENNQSGTEGALLPHVPPLLTVDCMGLWCVQHSLQCDGAGVNSDGTV